MRFPKSHIVVIFLLFSFSNGLFLNAQELLIKDNNGSFTCTFDDHRLEELIKNDSLFKATSLLNEALTFAKKFKLRSTEAQTYNAIGEVSAKMSSFKNAELYHKKSYNLYDSINSRKGKDAALSSLLKTYLLEKNYKRFDSLYPIAQELSSELNSELYFINLENKIKKNYYAYENKELLRASKNAIKLLDTVDFSKLVFSKIRDEAFFKSRLQQSYFYYKTIAHVKLNIGKKDRFDLLFNLSDDAIKLAFKEDPDLYRKLGTYNFYKYLYYTEVNKNLDSATKYLLAADTYKYNAVVTYEKRNSRNGDIMYNIINTQNELRHANDIRKQDAKASKVLLITLVLTAIMLITTLIIFFFYIRAKRNIQAINKALKRSNEKLLAIDKDRLEFFSIVSHELRTPIYGITGLATLVDQEPNKSKRKSYLNSLISSSNYLSILIDNILQVKKLRFEEKTLRLKPDQIHKIVQNVVSTVEIAAKNKGLKIQTNVDDSIANDFLMIDKVAFSQILINLAYNAVRYTKEGHIGISVKENKRTEDSLSLRFEVEDTGIGIDEIHRDVVFNAFENKTFLHKNSSGSGLGLFVVKTLLKCHDADIDFISKPGLGTKFFFEITFQRALSPIQTNTPKIDSIKHRHILIVDDNKINLLISKKNIERIEGYTCETLSNGREAISMIKEKAFDLVLMDINMPDMDGYEATKHIRMFNPHIPILALTALNSAEIALKAKYVGINQIITKPYIFEDFKAVIQRYANKEQHYFNCIDLEAI